MKQDQGSVDDLLVLARRGDLSESDERRFRELLASSPEARLLYKAGCAFDEEAPVVAGDDERIERIARMVSRLEKRPAAPAATRRRWIAMVSLAAALVAGAAVGAIELTKSPSRAPDPGPALSTPTTATAAPMVTSATRAQLLAPSASATPEPFPEPVPSATTVAPRAPTPASAIPERPLPAPPASAPQATSNTHAPAVDPPVSATASELFSAANRARVNGDAPEAIRLSRQLEAQFPASREAIATHLSLGLLYLQKGEPGPALDQFRGYRALGTPSAEAIWGESQALHQLGRTDEERAALQELLKTYPQSAYSAAAQTRLSDLH